ncbi:GreA/GreB family elongation factor [Cognatishimia activa]|uniref:GreA/GreB family elongation factor n=1 Tax=Cognatishimia activa TaxID=1715691 RepID=UPI00223200C2|nr:GreA/GreB family elongation factor [Cognatishimia activa]UZD89895.1 GreA/GreB family elongation factor [Cognatishimia activa]
MTDRATSKKAIHDRLMALEAGELAVAISHYEAHLSQSQTGDHDIHDKDDQVSARESRDLAVAFDAPVLAHHAKVDAIENTDFSLTDTVGPGAVVRFNNRCFVICVSTTRFDVEGSTYMGISTGSPIYQAMAGLKAGDSFAFNGSEFTIEDVL